MLIDFNCQVISDNHLKKMTSTQPPNKLLSDIKKLLKKEFEEEFEYFLIPGNVIEANKIIFDAITQSFAKTLGQYPHTLIAKSELLNHATYLQSMQLCKVTEINKELNTFQYQAFNKDFKCSTCFLSIPFACPDTGAVQMTDKISETCKKHKTIFHIDFTNSVKCLRLNPRPLGIGTFTFDFTQIGALHGISVLGVDKLLLKGYHITHIQDGSFNSGTLDTALSILKLNYNKRNDHNDHFEELKRKLEQKFKHQNNALIYLPNTITIPNLIFNNDSIIASQNLFGTKLIFNPNNTQEDIDLFISISKQIKQTSRSGYGEQSRDKRSKSRSERSKSRSERSKSRGEQSHDEQSRDERSKSRSERSKSRDEQSRDERSRSERSKSRGQSQNGRSRQKK